MKAYIPLFESQDARVLARLLYTFKSNPNSIIGIYVG